MTEIGIREAVGMKQKRAWLSSNALEVALLSVGTSFVLLAAVLASVVGLG